MTIAAVSAAPACFKSDRSQPRPSDTREETPPFGGTANSRQFCTTCQLNGAARRAASTTATHTACDHHCCGSAPSPAAAAIRKFRPGTTTRGHHSRAASISPLREENDLHGSICKKSVQGQGVTALTMAWTRRRRSLLSPPSTRPPAKAAPPSARLAPRGAPPFGATTAAFGQKIASQSVSSRLFLESVIYKLPQTDFPPNSNEACHLQIAPNRFSRL